MDDSQSSELFSQTSGNIHDSSTTQIETYEKLFTKIKTIVCEGINEKNLPQEQFIVILDDCKSCIFQSLDIIISLLADVNIQTDRLVGYLEDAVCILQILSNLLKNILESVVITCHTIKNCSTSTGSIILSVFTHCKDSECIYGDSLYMVEKQLKDLFRNCHELQLTYLMALEKHFIFDLTEKGDQDILMQTLEINLKIGDVVQTLDVKTMAEQWKAYTMICEKYSNFLLEKNIYNITSELLASTIENSINDALEAKEEDKIVLKSMKVANFSLKIMLRICNIFKCSVNNNYEHIVKLLFHLSLHNSSYYEVTTQKSSEFILLTSTHLSVPYENIIGTLINEQNFLKVIFLMEIGELKGSQPPGYVILVTMIMKALVNRGDVPSDTKIGVVSCVFSFLPHCHKLFNIGIKFKHISAEGKIQYYGMYEHLLLYTVALSSTLCPEDYNRLERYLYEALLGTEYYSSIFASNLWLLLCRFCNNNLQLNTLVELLNVYQKLETRDSFNSSPQKIHLSYTIEKLYQTLTDNKKLEILKRYSAKDMKNVGVWSALKIRNLCNDSKSIDKNICEILLRRFNDVNDNEGSLESLTKYLKLASTCTFVERNPKIEDLILNAWLKACPNCHNILQKRLDVGSIEYIRYLEALVSLTSCYMEKFQRRTRLVKILNIISNILLIGNIEAVHLLFIPFCKLSTFLLEVQNDITIITLCTNTVKNLINASDHIQQYIFSIIACNDDDDDDISIIIEYVFKNDKNIRNGFADYKNKVNDYEEWQKQLDSVAECKYIHKCMTINNIEVNDDIKSTFDLGDIDSLFGECEGDEPVCKKPKLNNDVDKLISKLETDVEQLCQFKENIQRDEYTSRIRCLCEKLKNIVS